MSTESYLELTYRHGKCLAGYLFLPRQDGDRVFRSQPHGDDLVVDYSEDDRPIGIEIVNPAHVSAEQIIALLAELHAPAVDRQELAPLAS